MAYRKGRDDPAWHALHEMHEPHIQGQMQGGRGFGLSIGQIVFILLIVLLAWMLFF